MFLTLYHKKNCNFKFINKFFYLTVNELPKIKKVLLIFKLNSYNLKLIAAHFLVLQQLSNVNKGFFIKSKKSNILIKIKKGNIIGCEFNIKNSKSIIVFIKKLILEILSVTPQKNNKNSTSKSASFQITNLILLTKFDKFFSIYNMVNKSNLNVVITFSLKKNELLYMLRKFQFNI